MIDISAPVRSFTQLARALEIRHRLLRKGIGAELSHELTYHYLSLKSKISTHVRQRSVQQCK